MKVYEAPLMELVCVGYVDVLALSKDNDDYIELPQVPV